MGWDLFFIHMGQGIMGNNSVIKRIISKEMLPEPAMTLARNSVTGTLPCRKVAPVSMRERRCGEMGWSIVSETAEINDVLYARLFRCVCKIVRGLHFEFGVSMSQGHVVDEIICGMHILKRRREGGRLHHVAVDNVYLAGPASGLESTADSSPARGLCSRDPIIGG